jgi:TolB-like protein/DNA-binding winged helix-turn-helix (wHTH) protein/Tfp pilus assembly protein PilF
MNAPKVKFGEFELDVAGYELTRCGRPIKLERIPMELLLLLVERGGQLVPRDEIFEKLWGKDVFLDVDNSINAAISKIRVALKDDSEGPTFIKTISGKGYRFIAPITISSDGKDAVVEPSTAPKGHATLDVFPVESFSTDAEQSHSSDPQAQQAIRHFRQINPERGEEIKRSARRWLWPSVAGVLLGAAIAAWSWGGALRHIVNPSPPPVIRSLAVLPLENLTGDASQEYFADGMTDALITDLAQIGTLRVISRTSIMRYKGVRKPLPEIARELAVDGIVEGTVTRSPGRIRITSQLIYAPSDQHLWAHSYERDIGDVVALQADVAQAIAGEVRAALTPELRARLGAGATTSPAAYEAYLRGRYYLNQRTPAGVEKSVEFFQQAVENDPNFALAYAGLADAYNFTNILGALAPKESSPEAKAAAAKALVLDPRLAEAHAALGVVKSHYDFDFPGAQKEFLKAIELNPNYSNAHLFYAGAYLTPMGRHKDAIAEMQRALEVDPLSVPLNNMLGQTYLWAEDYEKALQQFQRTIGLDPRFPLAHFFLAGLLEELGRFEEAIQENERGELLLGAAPEKAAAWAAESQEAFRSGGPQGYWRKNLGATLKAHRQAGTRYFEAITVAAAYARAGDKKNAFEWLEKSYEDREGQTITLIRWLPAFKGLRGDPRFADLMGRMGLPHYP